MLKAKWLDLPGEGRFKGFGVSACATCDGFFFRGKKVLVVGGGNSAVEEALYLANIAKEVVVVHRRNSFRAEKILCERLFARPNVTVRWNSAVDEILGQENPLGVTGARLRDVRTGALSTIEADGVFVAIVNIPDLVEDSLRMNLGSMSRHGVEVIRDFEKVPPVNVEKHKILQILINLLRNAKNACDESGRADKRLTVRVRNGRERLKISVIDNGVGIAPENLTRIFNHGFTTRKDGHGFGLHSGALAAREMGGSLTADSAGPGQGAAFTLELPLTAPEERPC